MNQPQLQFGEARRDAGIAKVEQNNQSWVDRMRAVARRMSNLNGSVSADELRRHASFYHDHPAHPNAWGGIFRGPGWQVVGRRKSTTVSAHAREIKVWRWVGTEARAA